jgi:hypothetical protein
MTNDNRRKHTRIAVDLKGSLRTAAGVEHACQLINLSIGGALVATETNDQVGDEVELHVALGDKGQSIAAKATVRWTGQQSLGLQFMPMGARATYLITEFLAKRERQSS